MVIIYFSPNQQTTHTVLNAMLLIVELYHFLYMYTPTYSKNVLCKSISLDS